MTEVWCAQAPLAYLKSLPLLFDMRQKTGGNDLMGENDSGTYEFAWTVDSLMIIIFASF